MKRTVLTYLALIVYVVCAAVPLVLLAANAWLSAVVLVGVPALWLYRQIDVSATFLAVVAAFAVVQASIWQMVAHASGAWYVLSVLPQHLFGVIPVESIFTTTVTFIFWIVAYEYFLDDRCIERFAWTPRRLWFAASLLTLAVVAIVLAVVFAGVVIPYAFLTMLGVLVATLILLAWWLPGQQSLVLEKVCLGVLLLLPLQLLIDLLSLINLHVVYGYPQQYMWSFTLFGELLPMEHLLSLLVLPFWVLALHEWLLDDET